MVYVSLGWFGGDILYLNVFVKKKKKQPQIYERGMHGLIQALRHKKEKHSGWITQTTQTPSTPCGELSHHHSHPSGNRFTSTNLGIVHL